MKNRSNVYWNNRANERMAEYHRNSDTTINKINAAYDKAIKDINEDINNIFYKYKLDSQLSEKEVKQLLNSKISKKELDDIRAKIYGIQDEELKKYMMAQLNSEAYKSRITRLEAMKESVYINTKLAADVEIKQSTKLYTDNINKAYYSNIFDIQKGLGIGFNVAEMPLGSVQEILKNNWSGKHYSKRVWKNTDILAEKLEEVITSALMSGKSSRRMAMELEELTNYGKFASERLIRTETTYISNEAEIESYKECGVDKYIFVATLDLRTSSACREQDRKIYRVDKAQAGINLPPLHPHCRSTTRAYLGKGTLKDINRRARDPETGKTYLVPGDMSYQEWYDKFVVDKYSKDNAEVVEKMIKNKSSDRKQFNNYKEVLGKESPKALKDFKDIKYNKINEWNNLKAQYRKINYYNKVIKNEPNITLDLKEISNNSGSELVGLDFRLKSKESYLRKVNTDSKNSLEPDIIKNVIEDTNDIIRYTYQSSYKDLTNKYFEINNALNEKGYNQIKLKNTWLVKSNPYKGVNCNYVAPSGQKFEIQYHTPESFELKNGELHSLYEKWRVIENKTSKEAIELSKRMAELSSKLKYPDNINKVR
ncbi:minor capsid protein [Clostridium sp.]|uniref:minor capsid protein n=1 Tax=Clostridium sp. TaxID=1506 RepID=UPI002908461A|nr:minor capsid protein [Clostridium sp.]MDU5106522.1 minor capsid protein [Clostridium sp.]